MTYQVGQRIEPSNARTYFGRDCEPRWNCVVVRSGAKAHIDCREMIREFGMFSFFPSREKTTKVFNKPVTREVPLDGCAGYVFAQFLREPQWDLWPNKPWFLDVFRIGETPYNFRYAQIRHLQGLTVDAERLARANAEMEAAAAEAARPLPGQRAAIVAGPFSGHTVLVDALDGLDALFDFMGCRARATASSLRRLAN